MADITDEDREFIDSLCGRHSDYTNPESEWRNPLAIQNEFPSYLWDEWFDTWGNTQSPNAGDHFPSQQFYCKRHHELPQYDEDEDNEKDTKKWDAHTAPRCGRSTMDAGRVLF